MTPPRVRWHWAYLLWLLVPLLLWWALRDVRPAVVWAALQRMGLAQIAALVGINALTLLAFTGRWWIILRAQGHTIPYLTLTRYRVAVFGISYFTPGPQFGGEPLQVFLLERHHAVPGAVAAAATALDKIIELLVNFIFLAVGLLLMTEWRVFPGLASAEVLSALLVLAALPVGFLLAAWLGLSPLTHLLERLPVRARSSPRYQRAYAVVRESETHVTHFCRTQPAALLGALAITLLSWGLILLEYWLGLAFLGLPLSAPQLITAVTLNRLAFLAPLPGGLGALESSQVLAMTALGLDPALGLTQGLIIRARDVLVGGLGLWWAGQEAARAPQRLPKNTMA